MNEAEYLNLASLEDLVRWVLLPDSCLLVSDRKKWLLNATAQDIDISFSGVRDERLEVHPPADADTIARIRAQNRVARLFADGKASVEDIFHARNGYRPSMPITLMPPDQQLRHYYLCTNLGEGPWLHRAAEQHAVAVREISGHPFRTPFHQIAVRTASEMSADALESGAREEESWRAPWITPEVVSLALATYESHDRDCDYRECRGRGKWTDAAGDSETCGRCGGTGYLYSGTFDPIRLSILADALEDAGCDHQVLVNHLRGLEPCNPCRFVPNTHPHDECWHHGLHPQCLICKGAGWRELRGPHWLGCWAIDFVLGKS